MNLRMLLAASCVVPFLAFAQTEEVEANVAPPMPGMPGFNMNVKVKESKGRGGGKANVHEEQSGDGFKVACDTDPDGDTWFKVLSPEGAQIRVVDDVGFPKAAGTVPVSFQAQGKKFYQVELRTPAGPFVKKFEAKAGMTCQVWIGGAPSGPAPAPAPVVAASACGPDSDLQGLSAAINEESFSDGKLRVLGDAAQGRGFCVDHAVVLIKLFSFEGDKIKALKLIAPRLTDRQNKFKIYKAFDFDSTRDEAKKVLQ